MKRDWKDYEDTARQILDRFKSEFGLSSVEGKQKRKGKSGATWELDAKGVREGDDAAMVVIECRRRRSARMKQEEIGGLAFRIQDLGAVGGIVVSPLPLQVGAALVAKSANIVHMQLRADSTPQEYLMRFLSKVFVGLAEEIHLTDSVTYRLTDSKGRLIGEDSD